MNTLSNLESKTFCSRCFEVTACGGKNLSYTYEIYPALMNYSFKARGRVKVWLFWYAIITPFDPRVKCEVQSITQHSNQRGP